MADVLTSLCVIFSLLFNGRSNVRTVQTENEYSHRFNFVRENGDLRVIVLICREYRHVLTHSRWYIPKRYRYTYAVEIIRVGDMRYSDSHIGHYPLLCHKRFVGSSFPHRCAINAHLDNIFN